MYRTVRPLSRILFSRFVEWGARTDTFFFSITRWLKRAGAGGIGSIRQLIRCWRG